jgi:hypothetical protein
VSDLGHALLLSLSFLHSSLDALREYIENKYVKGLWLSDEDRQFYMNEQAGIAL